MILVASGLSSVIILDSFKDEQCSLTWRKLGSLSNLMYLSVVFLRCSRPNYLWNNQWVDVNHYSVDYGSIYWSSRMYIDLGGEKKPSILFLSKSGFFLCSILTGWGKHSKVVGASTLRRVIESLLKSIGAPFQLERFNIGRFVSPSAVIASWLRESGTISILLLRDERSQMANPENLLPQLQALQL